MKVVFVNPIPPGPILIVWPLYTSVVGVAPGPNVNVFPPMTAIEEPISENVIPPAVIICVVGLNGTVKVAPPADTPLGPIVTGIPLMVVTVGFAP